MNCCVGDIRINYGKWYVPIGKTAQDCTYCEYCYKNGCVSPDKVTEQTEAAVNCNCDCPNKASHPKLVTIICPLCVPKPVSPDSKVGTCKKCKTTTYHPDMAYCPGCSTEVKSCSECGDEIKNGDQYLTQIEEKIKKSIEMHTQASKGAGNLLNNIRMH